MKDKKQFILDTLLPYFEDPSTCSYDPSKEQCLYFHPNGNRCALGKYLNKEYLLGKGFDNSSGAGEMFDRFDEDKMLVPSAQGILSIEAWDHVQSVHDALAGGDKVRFPITSQISYLEEATGLELPELYDAYEVWKQQYK